MTNPTTAVNPSRESLDALAARDDTGPIVMVNLLKFAQPDGRDRYNEYARVSIGEIARRGGHVIYSGQFLQTKDWDTVALVYYPSRGAYLDMQDSDAYQAAIPDRTAGLTRRLLFAFKEGPMPQKYDPIRKTDDDEIYVVNLLQFKQGGGAAEYGKYGNVAGKLIAERGGSISLLLEAEQAMVSDDDWERLILVRYPSIETLMEMTSTPTWREADSTHRQSGLQNTIAIPSKPLLRG
jgi:uncharacterized protein (DUF1330 family)